MLDNLAPRKVGNMAAGNASSAPSDEEPIGPPVGDSSPAAAGTLGLTRAGAAWVATGAALVLLIVLVVFMLQNLTKVEVQFLGLSGSIPLGLALLIAAVTGGVVVAVAGVARVTQLRMSVRRAARGTGS